ncbi:hypothetical protein BC628DRAFT_233625 [Trametes gibbosa]|nr:hypothetical protein BC628DRAFT_233625 [Trametes gibbosa]
MNRAPRAWGGIGRVRCVLRSARGRERCSGEERARCWRRGAAESSFGERAHAASDAVQQGSGCAPACPFRTPSSPDPVPLRSLPAPSTSRCLPKHFTPANPRCLTSSHPPTFRPEQPGGERATTHFALHRYPREQRETAATRDGCRPARVPNLQRMRPCLPAAARCRGGPLSLRATPPTDPRGRFRGLGERRVEPPIAGVQGPMRLRDGHKRRTLDRRPPERRASRDRVLLLWGASPCQLECDAYSAGEASTGPLCLPLVRLSPPPCDRVLSTPLSPSPHWPQPITTPVRSRPRPVTSRNSSRAYGRRKAVVLENMVCHWASERSNSAIR